MRWIIPVVINLTILIGVDLYAYQAFKALLSQQSPLVKRILLFVYWGISIGMLLTLLSAFIYDFDEWNKTFKIYFFALFLILFVSKFTLAFFVFIDDIIRGIKWFKLHYFSSNSTPTDTENGISRSQFLLRLGLGAAAIPFVSLVWGMMANAYNYQKRRVTLHLPNLPKAFEGYKIVQISDVHSGSFTNPEKVMQGIDMINEENADTVFFTGDIVNEVATEFEPYQSIFGKITAKDGVFSVLGNHDYGKYRRWENDEEKEANLNRLIELQKGMGWDLLLDEHRFIEKNGEKIAIIGVQNWSSKFGQVGDLKKAYTGCEDCAVKLLLSHDPSHWDAEINTEFNDIDLTLSGHTHGFQFGIEIPGYIKWSPSQWIYKQWAGLYNKGKQYIYVNRGFGFLGYPGRVGILPEITVITLKKGEHNENLS